MFIFIYVEKRSMYFVQSKKQEMHWHRYFNILLFLFILLFSSSFVVAAVHCVYHHRTIVINENSISKYNFMAAKYVCATTNEKSTK